MGQRAESAHVGSKVLPICETTRSSSTDADYSSDTFLSKKKRVISRMKELLRWAVAAKSEKGANKRWKVPYFRNGGASKSPYDDMSSSSKITFTWDMGSCSTASALSPLSFSSSFASHRTVSKDLKQQLESISKETSVCPKSEESVRKGNWITTDSEFVVLEL